MEEFLSDKFVLGQYFTKTNAVEKLVGLLLKYKRYPKRIRILEPSFGAGGFINVLKRRGFVNIESCEIDPRLTKNPADFFLYPLEEKFDLIIGNPPFTKYNVRESYYTPKKYLLSKVNPEKYLTKSLASKRKTRLENAFILKSIKHLRNENSSIAFILPISFFIKNKNNGIKKELAGRFSTVIIYQDDTKWFDEPIQCCFAIFTNAEKLKDKIILLYRDGEKIEIKGVHKLMTEELIPRSSVYKKTVQRGGIPLSKFLSPGNVRYKKSYTSNDISASNILEKAEIPAGEDASGYYIAVVRVGNASVGRAGFVDTKKNVLNDMFYVFGFRKEFDGDKGLKEKICKAINDSQGHFRRSVFRVGSKSLKKSDILNLAVKI